jgi:hypothetical protein
MGSRFQLHDLFKSIIGPNAEGKYNVYFQPPSTITMRYPCIKYSIDDMDTIYADDMPYAQMIRYQVTIIDSNPDSLLPGRVSTLPLCKFDRAYASNNLNHTIFNLYY